MIRAVYANKIHSTNLSYNSNKKVNNLNSNLRKRKLEKINNNNNISKTIIKNNLMDYNDENEDLDIEQVKITKII